DHRPPQPPARALRFSQPADHELLPRGAFDRYPALAAAGGVKAVEVFADDSLPAAGAHLFQQPRPPGDRSLGPPDARGPGDQPLENRVPLGQRHLPHVIARDAQYVEEVNARGVVPDAPGDDRRVGEVETLLKLAEAGEPAF